MISLVYHFFRTFVVDRNQLALEIVTLRQQVAELKLKRPRPTLRNGCRLFWAILSKIWSRWKETLIIVQPDTVVRWQRNLFKIYWNWKSRKGRKKKKPDRPKIPKEARDLIRKMSRKNPTWGVPRIQAEMHMLGYDISEPTVRKYMDRSCKPPSPTWKVCLASAGNGQPA